jgi:hypothetical protein
VTNSNDLSVSQIEELALLGVLLGDLSVPIGTGCTPIDILGGVQCNANTVNCGQVYSCEFLLFCRPLVFMLLNSLLSTAALIGINCVPVIVNA